MVILDSTCEAWPLPFSEEDKMRDVSFTHDMFFITLNVFLTQELRHETQQNHETGRDEFRTKYVNCIWRVDRDQLINNETSKSVVHDKLSELGIQAVKDFMVEKILNRARAIASDVIYSGCRVMRMLVFIRPYVDTEYDVMEEEEEDDDDDDDEYEVDDDEDTGFEGASKSAIESLEVAEVEGYVRLCTVCLEDVVVGSKATRLPCSHLYHGVCIGSWLEKSKLCPLRRFEIS